MKYIIYCGPGIGDFIMMLPLAKTIKHSDPGAHIELFSMMSSKLNYGRMESVRLLLQIQDYIQNIGYYCLKEPIKTLQWLLRLGYHQYDVGLVLQSDNRSSTSPWPCRIIHFVAQKTAGISFLNKKEISYDENCLYSSQVRVIEQGLDLLEKLGIPRLDYIGPLINHDKLSAVCREFINIAPQRDKKNIALCLGAASLGKKIHGQMISKRTKNWPYTLWKELAQRFADSQYNIFLLGGKKEQEEFREVAGEVQCAEIKNFAGRCNIIESIFLISRCSLVIGADTGMMHCAGAMDIPSITLFGCTSPSQFLAYGSHSYYVTANEKCAPCYGQDISVLCENVKCMNNISVDMVYDKAMSILKK